MAPDVRKTGGKVISSSTRKGKGRLARAFMHAANAIGNMKTGGYLVHFFKRIHRRRQRSVAIIATANKLSKIIWTMLVKKPPYNPVMPAEYLDTIRKKEVKIFNEK